jgi:hypothetical protein
VSDGALVGGLVCGAFVVFFAVMIPIITLVNRQIGAAYTEKARAIEPILASEGLRFAEDDVAIRGTWMAPLAIGVRWSRADVRVTERAIYLMQHTRMFGQRIGQPIIALPLRGAILDPRVVGSVHLGWLETYPREEGGAVVLRGGLGVQRFTMRLAVRDVAGFVRSS